MIPIVVHEWITIHDQHIRNFTRFERAPVCCLVSFPNAITTATDEYRELGDRLMETVNGVTTTFTMDLNPSTSLWAGSGLTQALSDGTNTYICGVGRIAQVNTATVRR